MINPCIGCEREAKDKKVKRCANCKKRVDYDKWVIREIPGGPSFSSDEFEMNVIESEIQISLLPEIYIY